MRIRTLRAEDRKAVEQVASLLLEGFKEHHPTAWPDMESALKEVKESFGQDRLSRIAVDDSGAVLGWIGGIRQYDGNVWELHPLVVRASHQRTGIGRVLRPLSRSSLTRSEHKKSSGSPLRVLPKGGLRSCRRDARRQRLGKAGHLYGQTSEKRLSLSDRQLIWKKKS